MDINLRGIEITKEQARSFLVSYHGLVENKYIGKEGILEYIKKVGCIQFDPLNVVGRNPDLVLQSRVHNYDPDMLYNLLYRERSLIDGWDKMMSIYHISDWSMMGRVREAHSKQNIYVMKKRGTVEALNYLKEVKHIIRESGPKYSREISFGGVAKGRWSSSKYSNVALDHLLNLGELGIAKKRGTQKQYDLIENLISSSYLDKEDVFMDEYAFCKWYTIRRIRSIGLLWNRNGGAWLGHFISSKESRINILKELVVEGVICPVNIQGINEVFYIHVDDKNELLTERKEHPVVKFLAPLDNLLWDRDMVERIFDFKYSWEVYIPKAKRKYGYYVIPVLYGDQIIARFEPAKDNKNEEFDVENWWWEKNIRAEEEHISAIMEAFNLFGEFMKRKVNYGSVLSKIESDIH